VVWCGVCVPVFPLDLHSQFARARLNGNRLTMAHINDMCYGMAWHAP
jgi:hypothetical protein